MDGEGNPLAASEGRRLVGWEEADDVDTVRVGGSLEGAVVGVSLEGAVVGGSLEGAVVGGSLE